jgi:hypothetical protein
MSSPILRCIETCRKDRTTGTRRRAELKCAKALGGTKTDFAVAAAARRIGTWLAGK